MIRDLTGQKFGALVARWPVGSVGKNHKAIWLFSCNCGRLRVAVGAEITRPRTKVLSCGYCSLYRRNERHGATRVGQAFPEYAVFNAARRRCVNPESDMYRLYGARGIKFLFESFDQFIRDVGRRPSSRHSLDRIDNDGNYEPGNCRWATPEEQYANRRIKFLKDFTTEELLAELKRRGA